MSDEAVGTLERFSFGQELSASNKTTENWEVSCVAEGDSCIITDLGATIIPGIVEFRDFAYTQAADQLPLLGYIHLPRAKEQRSSSRQAVPCDWQMGDVKKSSSSSKRSR